MHSRGGKRRQRVGADETADIRKKVAPGASLEPEPDISQAELDPLSDSRLIRGLAEAFGADAEKKVMHHRIADKDGRLDAVAFYPALSEKPLRDLHHVALHGLFEALKPAPP